MIRVLHFIPAYDIGGVESLIMSLYRNVDKSRVQFDFLVETQEWLEEFNEIVAYGGRVYQLKLLNKKKPLQYIKQIKNFFSQNAQDYSVLHCHNVERSLIVLYYARKYNINCRIFHAHTDSFEGINYERIVKMIVRLDINLSTHFFASSQATGDFQFKKDNKPYIVLKNAIDTKKFTFFPEKRDKMRLLMGFKNSFVIGHTGRFTYAKNHWKIIDVFVEIYQRLPSARLLLVGDGPTRQEIEKKVQTLGLSDVVVFMGNKKNISDILQCMDVFLLPSFFEGFCISLLEAQSVGLPCIASNIIPTEVQITELITKLDLNDNDKKWADAILSYQDYNRKSHHEIIVAKGYDANENANWLMNFYLDKAVKETII